MYAASPARQGSAQILRRGWRRSGSGGALAGARTAPALVGHRDATTRRLFIAPMPQNWAIKKKGRPWLGQLRKKDVDSSGRSFTADPNPIGSPMVDDTAAPSDTEPADDGPKDEPKRTSLAVKPSGDTAFFTAVRISTPRRLPSSLPSWRTPRQSPRDARTARRASPNFQTCAHCHGATMAKLQCDPHQILSTVSAPEVPRIVRQPLSPTRPESRSVASLPYFQEHTMNPLERLDSNVSLSTNVSRRSSGHLGPHLTPHALIGK